MIITLPRVRALLPRLDILKKFALQIFPYWLAAAVTALISVGYARAFGAAEGVVRAWAHEPTYWALLIIPVTLIFSAGLAMIVSPEAAGSGIPQLIAAVDLAPSTNPGADLIANKVIARLLSFRMMIVKFLSSCLCVAGGGVTGREGPMLQIAAGVFYQIQRRWPAKLNRQSMILAGGAAGLASAFNTPLGGIVFAIEELGKIHLTKIRTAIFHSVIIAGLFAQAALGNYLYIGKITVSAVSAPQLWPIVLAAGFIGLCGATMGSAIVKCMDWRARTSLPRRFAMTLVCGLGVAGLYLFMTRHSADGADQALGSGRSLIVDLLAKTKQPADFVLAVERGVANFLTYISGSVCGIFAPSLATGAALGSFFSEFFPQANAQIWILCGMVAFLTGVTRTPFTSMILVLEMTDSHSAIIDLMVCAVAAQAAARLVDPMSFYEHMSIRILKTAGLEQNLELDAD